MSRYPSEWAVLAVSVACSLLLGGCAHYVPTVTAANQCDPKDLPRSCATPTNLPADTTYGSLLKAYLADREALRECQNRIDGLNGFITRCNAEIDDFNRRLAEDIAKVKSGQ
jgi:hypothetical protein